MTKCNLKDKIKVIIMKLKLASNASTDKELSDVFGIDKGLFASWKNQRQQIPIEYLIDFCDNYNVSLDWLLRGDGLLKTQVSSRNIKIPYFVDYDFTKSSNDVILPIEENKIDIDHDIRAIKSTTTELPRTAPIGSIMLFDFEDVKVTESPQTYLIKAGENYFIREVTINARLQYYISSENERIEKISINYDGIEVIAKFIGVIKWKN